jgi:exodeoxyribonuclease-3
VRIATWNVNSVKARLPRLVSWLADRRPVRDLTQQRRLPDEQMATLDDEKDGPSS